VKSNEPTFEKHILNDVQNTYEPYSTRSTEPFETLTMLLKDHRDPHTSEIADQHQFLLRIQHEGESIANFVADLKMYTTYFNFVYTSCKKFTYHTSHDDAVHRN
jgi:hypothetical protein